MTTPFSIDLPDRDFVNFDGGVRFRLEWSSTDSQPLRGEVRIDQIGWITDTEGDTVQANSQNRFDLSGQLESARLPKLSSTEKSNLGNEHPRYIFSNDQTSLQRLDFIAMDTEFKAESKLNNRSSLRDDISRNPDSKIQQIDEFFENNLDLDLSIEL